MIPRLKDGVLRILLAGRRISDADLVEEMLALLPRNFWLVLPYGLTLLVSYNLGSLSRHIILFLHLSILMNIWSLWSMIISFSISSYATWIGLRAIRLFWVSWGIFNRNLELYDRRDSIFSSFPLSAMSE